jgi:hypothetical protein
MADGRTPGDSRVQRAIIFDDGDWLSATATMDH